MLVGACVCLCVLVCACVCLCVLVCVGVRVCECVNVNAKESSIKRVRQMAGSLDQSYKQGKLEQ